MLATKSEALAAVIPNPFPVFPVSSLRDIAPDILEKTVFTDSVVSLDAAIQEYERHAMNGALTGVAIQVRGDYGAGKTHLLVFAQARLRSVWPGGREKVRVLSAPATETPFPRWYLTVVAPLFEQIDLPRLFCELLAAAACDVADRVPLTATYASAIRSDPFEVYPILQKGLLSQTDVERALVSAVAALVPRRSGGLRAVLAALAWPDRQDTALRWLAGRKLDAAEHEQLGVSGDLDAEADAAAVLVAIAGAARDTGGVFALVIDEFEHLMAEDKRTDTRRNATVIKRLLEEMTRVGALVLVAGHWRAWEQLADFKARFASQPSIDVVTLTGKEIGALVLQYAPEWAARLNDAAMEAVAEAGGRNIRRVLAILHQFYADTAASSGPLTIREVESATETRRRLNADTGRPDVVVEEVVRAAGGQVTRNEALFDRLRFDLVARSGEDLRLVADVRHAATSVELTRLLDDFSIGISALRMRFPSVRGLLVVTGAVEPKTLAVVNAMPFMEALPGEGPGWEAALRSATRSAFEAGPVAGGPVDAATVALEETTREAVRDVRVKHEEAALATRGRLEGINFGTDDRGVATAAIALQSAPTMPTSAFGSDAAVLDSFSENMRTQVPTFFSCMLVPKSLVYFTLFVGGLTFLLWLLFSDKFSLPSILGINAPSEDMPSYYRTDYLRAVIIINFSLIALGASLCVMPALMLIYRYHSEQRAFVRYQRWGRQKLEEMLVFGSSGEELLRVKNQLIDAPDAYGGFTRAFGYVNEVLPPWLRDRSLDRPSMAVSSSPVKD